jgi:hypothetical protein
MTVTPCSVSSVVSSAQPGLLPVVAQLLGDVVELLGTRTRRGPQGEYRGLVVGELRDDRGLSQIQQALGDGVHRDLVVRDRRGGLDPLGGDVPTSGDLPRGQTQAQQLLGSAGLLGVADCTAVLVLPELIEDPVDHPVPLVGEHRGLNDDPDPVQTGLDGRENAFLPGLHHQAPALVATNRDDLTDAAVLDVGDEPPLQLHCGAHIVADDQLAGIDPDNLGVHSGLRGARHGNDLGRQVGLVIAAGGYLGGGHYQFS